MLERPPPPPASKEGLWCACPRDWVSSCLCLPWDLCLWRALLFKPSTPTCSLQLSKGRAMALTLSTEQNQALWAETGR